MTQELCAVVCYLQHRAAVMYMEENDLRSRDLQEGESAESGVVLQL